MMDQSNPTPWIIIPFIDNLDQTKNAIQDSLNQTVAPNVLAIDNGSSEETALAIDEWSYDKPRLFIWHHSPPLKSLAATWNLALRFVWGLGNEVAMVCNNDIRLKPETYHQLSYARASFSNALFISGVGVTEEQFNIPVDSIYSSKGGPDFSCYLVSKECHDRYQFDEEFIPAYCEDLDYHRRLLLSGDGDRIFSVNVPYLHIDNGSGTLKSVSPERRAKIEYAINNGSRAYYKQKWGGPVNEEQYTVPFNPIDSNYSGLIRTQDLFNQVREGWK